jgi:hypothetical protein
MNKGGIKMFRLKRFCLIMIIFAWLMLPGPSVMAARTILVNTGFISERITTFISLYRDRVASPMPLLVSELAHNVDALDNAFYRLQNTGRLLPGHPLLVIEISDDALLGSIPSGPKAAGYAVLSLENDYRLDLYPLHTYPADTIDFGPVYRIQLSLRQVSINELFTLVFLLPELSAGQPRKELLAEDIRQYRDKFDYEIAYAAREWSNGDLLWSPDGNLLLLAHWYNRRLSYHVFNFAANEQMSLERLEHYILPPTFSPGSRFIFYASQTELKIVDVVGQKTHSLSLREKMPYDYQAVNWIDYAVNETEGSLFFTFGGWAMNPPGGLLWRGPAPGMAEMKNLTEWHEGYLAEFGRSAGTGVPAPGNWSAFIRGAFPSTINTLAEFADLERKIAAAKNVRLTAEDKELKGRFGAFYSKAVNYPQNSRLAILDEVDGWTGLEARVLSLPSLEEIDIRSFALVPEPKTEIPGRIAGISLFNVIVLVLLLLMAAGMTKLIIFVQQKYGRQTTTVPLSKRNKYLLFAGTLLITLLLHFTSGIYLLTEVIDDNMGDSAIRIAQQAIEQKYAGLGYTVVEFTPSLKAMTGSSLR